MFRKRQRLRPATTRASGAAQAPRAVCRCCMPIQGARLSDRSDSDPRTSSGSSCPPAAHCAQDTPRRSQAAKLRAHRSPRVPQARRGCNLDTMPRPINASRSCCHRCRRSTDCRSSLEKFWLHSQWQPPDRAQPGSRACWRRRLRGPADQARAPRDHPPQCRSARQSARSRTTTPRRGEGGAPMGAEPTSHLGSWSRTGVRVIPARSGDAWPNPWIVKAAQFAFLPPISDRGNGRSLERLADTQSDATRPLRDKAAQFRRVHRRRLAQRQTPGQPRHEIAKVLAQAARR
jgi:hypothetical protein